MHNASTYLLRIARGIADSVRDTRERPEAACSCSNNGVSQTYDRSAVQESHEPKFTDGKRLCGYLATTMVKFSRVF